MLTERESFASWFLVLLFLAGIGCFRTIVFLLAVALVRYVFTSYERKLPPNQLKVAIVGAGYSGIAMGIKCKNVGLKYEIYESADSVGGAWRDNIYPGCACDIPSHLYSYSFELNPNWSRKYPQQLEIWDYLDSVAKKHNLNIKFGRKVTRAKWNLNEKRYKIEFENGETSHADILINAVGPLREVVFPKIPGIGDFQGESFHSARWNKNYDHTGKRVAVIGTGATAIQVVPSICDQVKELFLFQRTPGWVPRKNDRTYYKPIRWIFGNVPLVMYLYRCFIHWQREIFYVGIFRHGYPFPSFYRIFELRFHRLVNRLILNRKLANQVIPAYSLGCKRITPSDTYLQSLNNENVQLIATPIEKIGPNYVQTQGEHKFEVDCIVYATGYEPLESLINAYTLENEKGEKLNEMFTEDVPRFFKGSMVPGFPNFFAILGANTNLGHHSLVWMAECQINYIVRVVHEMIVSESKTVEPSKAALDRYYEFIASYLLNKAFGPKTSCYSWYKKGGDGANFSLWPCTVMAFWWETLSVRPSDFIWGKQR